MKKEPFRSLFVTTLIYVIFFGTLLIIELDVKIFPPREAIPIELAFQVGGISDEPDAEPPKEVIPSPPSIKEDAILTTSDPSSFNAALVNKVDTTVKINDTLAGSSGSSGGGINSGSDSAGGSFGTGKGSGYVYDVSMVQDMPSFLGGGIDKFREWVVVSIRSGNYTIKNSDKGVIIINFTIDESGNVENVNIRKGINDQLDDEVVKIFKASPRWEPAKQQGHPVKVQFNFPIHF